MSSIRAQGEKKKKFCKRIDGDRRLLHLACAYFLADEKASHLCTGVLQTSEEADQFKFMSHIANGKDALIFTVLRECLPSPQHV